MASHFQDTRLSNIRKAALNDPRKALSTVEHTLYTLNTHPQGPNFTLFRSTTSRFRDTMLSKIGNAPNDPIMTLTT